MKVQCSYCPQKYEVSSELLGKTVMCQLCGKSFVVAHSAVAPQVKKKEPTRDSFVSLFEDDGKKDASETTDTTMETQVSDNQRSWNTVADRLNNIGNILFVIAVGLAVVLFFVGIADANVDDRRGNSEWKPEIFLLWFGSGIGHLIIVWIVKTLFTGFAELIQITHDIRKDIQSK